MKRVVITGLGVVAANATGVPAFEQALREGTSGITRREEMVTAGFACQVAGVPVIPEDLLKSRLSPASRKAMNSSMIFAGLAAIECWQHAGFSYDCNPTAPVDWETGALIGTGVGGIETIAEQVAPLTNAGQIRRLGSTSPEQSMASNVSACIGGLLALGGPVFTNSSACATGSDAVYNAYLQVAYGKIKRMLAGSAEGSSHYTWSGFDSMRVLNRQHNATPDRASRPMSATASGFIPSAGAGMLLLESLESAQSRGARIYGEVLGGHSNCGGQRNGGSITASNCEGVRRCISEALQEASILPSDVDYINGHLTSTGGDPKEIENISAVLQRPAEQFPLINSTKSMIGHSLGAAGSIECVATVLQLARGFVHRSLNCEDLHPSIVPIRRSIPESTITRPIRTALKMSFGFGDVNTCLVLGRYID